MLIRAMATPEHSFGRLSPPSWGREQSRWSFGLLGENDQAAHTYQSSSFFALYEFPSLASPRVSKLVVLDVHNEGVGESCGEGSLVTLETLSVAKFGASGYTCYDVIGNASLMDMEVVKEIVDTIHMEQLLSCECTSNQPAEFDIER